MLALLTLFLLGGAVAQSPPEQVSPPAGAADAVRFDLLHFRDRVESDGIQTRTMDVRVQLGNAQGVAQFGQIGVPYVDGYGDVQFEDVAIEKQDGRRVEVKNGLVEDLNPFGVSGTSVPADVRVKKLTIPGLEPGDTLSYRIVDHRRPLAPGRAFGELKLSPLPGGTLQTYELDLPRQSDIKVRLRAGLGASWEDVASAQDRLVRKLALKLELPRETRQLTKDERQAWIEPDVIFTSFGSWAEVSGWWWQLSKERLKPDAALAKEASALTGGAPDARAKIAALHAFITTRIRYLNVSFGLGRMQPRSAAEVLQNRYGDCKDKHTLLAALAASLGLDVRPVLISSSRAELHDDVPGPQQFDHMISVVRLGRSPADWLWLDGANAFAGPGYLLPQLRDKRALLIEADGAALLVRTPKEPPFVPRQDVLFKGALEPEGLLRGRVTWLLRSDEESRLRAVFSMVTKDRLASVIAESLAGAWKEAAVENVLVSDLLDVSSPLRVEFDVEKKVPAQGSQRSLRVPFPEFELPEFTELVPADEPVVSFPLRQMSARAEIEIPAAYHARLPLSVSLERPFGTFRSAYSVDGRALKLERSLALSQPSLGQADRAAYESFRNGIETDRKQEFVIEGAPAPGVPTASGLLDEGVAAFGKKDYARAVELLQKATQADPKLEDGFEYLGRALDELGRSEEALAAFSRQIETAPFHETAYAWRAYVLGRLDRSEEAEQDLLKQVEVAPFKAWSYERLGARRLSQQRFGEAADFYVRAATLEPKKAQRWLDLGLAQARAGRASDARKSLEQVAALDPPDWMTLSAAATYRFVGDLTKAGELAQKTLPGLTRRLARLTPDQLSEQDLYWADRLVEAWGLVGEAASAAGDQLRSERFLEAAWRAAFSAQAGWALGDLRAKQGRLADAVELWSMAASVPDAALHLPADRQARIEGACRKLPASARSPGSHSVQPTRPPRQVEAEGRLMELRTIRLTGLALANLTADVLLLADGEGRVERVLGLAPKDPGALERQVVKFSPIRLPLSSPDQEPLKLVRRALLACTADSGCALYLDLPGTGKLATKTLGSIRISRLSPSDGATLERGQQVALSTTVRYELDGESGTVLLIVQDQSGKFLSVPPSETVTARSGETSLAASFIVPADASWIDVYVSLGSRRKEAAPTGAGARYTVKAR